MYIEAALITFSLCALSLAPYAVWASRWNIPAHMSLAFAVTAYLIPGLLTDGINGFGKELVDLYANILFVGAVAFCSGIALGAVVKSSNTGFSSFFTERDMKISWMPVVSKRVLYVAFFGIVGLLLSFAIMGFIPLFADDPFSAKFFRGQYKEAYERVAPLYRSAHFSLSLLVPVLFSLWVDTRRRIYMALAVCSVVVLSLSLTRSPAAVGLVMWISIWVAHRPKFFWLYLGLLVFIYSFGGASFLLFSSFLSGQSYELSVWDFIAQGAPDIVDQLNFLEAFGRRNEFTYGLTVFGGLVPGNFKWNPSVWTLAVINDTDDVSSIASGGLRLPAPLWGYANFSWVGVVLFCFVAGYVTARATLYLKRFMQSASFTHSAIVLAIHASVWSCLINFYRLSFYTIFQILIVYILAGTWGALARKSRLMRA